VTALPNLRPASPEAPPANDAARTTLGTHTAGLPQSPPMATRHDSHSAASTAALSSHGYAYAYPFAWRFS